MATPWLRLWVDMPNDPKWRTIARSSKQTISSVLAVYLHILVIGSNATERGRTHGLCSEDIGGALDLETDQVDSILCAMQGKVLDDDYITGWEKRQPIREDGSSERGKAHREAKKLASNATERTANAPRTQPNATERKQTPEVEVDIEVENTSLVDFADEQDDFDCLEEIPLPTNDAERALQQHLVLVDKPKAEFTPGFAEFWSTWPSSERKQSRGKCYEAWKKIGAEKSTGQILDHIETLKSSDTWRKDGGQYILAPLVYLNQRRWEGVETRDTGFRSGMLAGAI